MGLLGCCVCMLFCRLLEIVFLVALIGKDCVVFIFLVCRMLFELILWLVWVL